VSADVGQCSEKGEMLEACWLWKSLEEAPALGPSRVEQQGIHECLEGT